MKLRCALVFLLLGAVRAGDDDADDDNGDDDAFVGPSLAPTSPDKNASTCCWINISTPGYITAAAAAAVAADDAEEANSVAIDDHRRWR